MNTGGDGDTKRHHKHHDSESPGSPGGGTLAGVGQEGGTRQVRDTKLKMGMFAQNPVPEAKKSGPGEGEVDGGVLGPEKWLLAGSPSWGASFWAGSVPAALRKDPIMRRGGRGTLSQGRR